MDDFGSGYSNMNLLGSLPLQIIKLDKVFLKEADEHDRASYYHLRWNWHIRWEFRSFVKVRRAEQHVNFLKKSASDLAQDITSYQVDSAAEFDQKYPVFEKRVMLPPRHMARSGISMVPTGKRSRRMLKKF